MNAARRLSDKIIEAHRLACEQDEGKIADILMVALENDLSRRGGDDLERRQHLDELEAAIDLHKETFGRLPMGLPTD